MARVPPKGFEGKHLDRNGHTLLPAHFPSARHLRIEKLRPRRDSESSPRSHCRFKEKPGLILAQSASSMGKGQT